MQPAQERVQCAECGTSYDSVRHPFCPRCGSLKAGEPVATGPRADSLRRRVHMAGIVLVLMGLAAIIPMGVTLANPPSTDPTTLESLSGSRFAPGGPGGTLALDVSGPGSDAVAVEVRAWNGTLVETHMVDGTARIGMPEPFANVTLRTDYGSWVRLVYAPAGKTAHLGIDLATASAEPSWVSVDLEALVRITAGVGLAGGLVVLAGGVAALRQRAFPLAVTGAALGLGGSLLLAVAVPVLLLNVLLSLAALVFIVRGRVRFRRRRG